MGCVRCVRGLPPEASGDASLRGTNKQGGSGAFGSALRIWCCYQPFESSNSTRSGLTGSSPMTVDMYRFT